MNIPSDPEFGLVSSPCTAGETSQARARRPRRGATLGASEGGGPTHVVPDLEPRDLEPRDLEPHAISQNPQRAARPCVASFYRYRRSVARVVCHASSRRCEAQGELPRGSHSSRSSRSSWLPGRRPRHGRKTRRHRMPTRFHLHGTSRAPSRRRITGPNRPSTPLRTTRPGRKYAAACWPLRRRTARSRMRTRPPPRQIAAVASPAWIARTRVPPPHTRPCVAVVRCAASCCSWRRW